MLGPHLFPPRADGTDPRQCPTCGTASCRSSSASSAASSAAPNYPECRYTRQLTASGRMAAADGGTKKLGEDPATGLEVTLRNGRFGPYVQLGEMVETARSPSAPACPRAWRPTTSISTRALALAVAAARGRQASRGRRADPRRHRPLRSLCAARQDLRQSRRRRRRAHRRAEPRRDPDRREGRQGSEQEPLRRRRPAAPLGDHPDKGGPIVVKTGRYGPYVSHDGVNATLPSDKTPETLTLEEAVSLLDARATDGRPSTARRRPAARGAAAKTKAKSPRAKPAPATGPERRQEARPQGQEGRELKSSRPTPWNRRARPSGALRPRAGGKVRDAGGAPHELSVDPSPGRIGFSALLGTLPPHGARNAVRSALSCSRRCPHAGRRKAVPLHRNPL